MKLRARTLTLAAALLTSTAAIAQEGGLSLGVTGGVSVFALPGMETGIFPGDGSGGDPSGTIDDLGAGIHLGASGSYSLGRMGDYDASIGINSFIMVGRSSATQVESFDGPGVVVIPGYTTPAGEITLTTNGTTPAADSDVTAQGLTLSYDGTNVGGVTNSWGVTVAGDESAFIYGAYTIDGPNDAASAYGAIGAEDGGIFIAAGDLTGLEIETTVSREILYGGADLTLAIAGSNNNWVLHGYAGPSYRFLGQRGSTDIAINIPEVEDALDLVFPDLSINRDETLSSHYLGGVVGVSGSTTVSDNALLTLGVEGGLYYTVDRLVGTESYFVGNGALTAVDPVTVVNGNTAFDTDNGMAFAARGNAALTLPIAENRQITFGGQAEYLSRVATVSRGNGTGLLTTNTYNPDVNGDIGDLTYDTASDNRPILSFGSMWNFTGTISFTGQF